MYKVELVFHRCLGSYQKHHFHGGGMDILWISTILTVL